MFECGSSGDRNAAARVVTLSPKFCHITPVLVNLHWLRIDLRIEFKMFTVTYKTLHGPAPTHIKDLLQSYLAAEDLRASKKKKSACRTCFQHKHGRRAFSVATSLLWNILPQHIRDAGSLHIFKRQLKTVLFRRAFLN